MWLDMIDARGLLSALGLMFLLGLLGSMLLQAANRLIETQEEPLVDKINDCLPQTQCGQCGHPGCRPYAEAIVQGELHNKCPPGGDETIIQLADLLSREVIALDEAQGETAETPMLALIREDECIGCLKCIHACPVDAIIGAQKKMHTVVADLCTGCELCIEPCPMDCIDLISEEVYQQQALSAQYGVRYDS